jgi:hypothetical protein
MATCIRCKGHVEGPVGETCCVICASEIVDHYATQAEIMALARVGINALIDEATGYQKERNPNDLRVQLFKEINKRLPEKLNCWEILPKRGK